MYRLMSRVFEVCYTFNQMICFQKQVKHEHVMPDPPDASDSGDSGRVTSDMNSTGLQPAVWQ